MRGSGDSIALRGADRLFSNYADFEAVGALILYLMDDCCGKSAALCDPIAASIRC